MKMWGMNVRDKEFLLLQFADDTEMYLDGNKKSFIESVKILRVFLKFQV